MKIVENAFYMLYNTIMDMEKKHFPTDMENSIITWFKSEEIERTLNIRCIFCRKFYFSLPNPGQWVIQPFTVLVMITGGRGRIIVADKPDIKLQPRQAYLLPTNIKRRPHATDAEGFEVLAMGFSVEILGGVDLLNFFEIPQIFRRSYSENIGKLMLNLYAMESAPRTNPIQYIAERKKICYEIFGKIIAVASLKNGITFPFMNNSYCMPAIKYLKENFTAPLDIDRLMKLCCLSRTHFFRLFKHQTNGTPFEYIKRLRLQEAQNLLLNTTLSVKEIGCRAGWQDPFHFSRIFKNEIGVSPTRYRAQF